MSIEARQAVIKEALSWIGTPVQHMARVKGAGCDCATFLLEVYEKVGVVPHTDLKPYPVQWYLHQDRERYMEWIIKHAHPVETPQPADLALYRIGKPVSHGAIVIAWPEIIHASAPAVRRDYALMPVLAKRFHGFYSFWSD